MTSFVASVQSFGAAAACIIATLSAIFIVGICETVRQEIKYLLDDGSPPIKNRLCETVRQEIKYLLDDDSPPIKNRKRKRLSSPLVKIIDWLG